MLPCRIDVRCPSFQVAARSAARRHRSFRKALNETLASIETDCQGRGDSIAGSAVTLDIRRIKFDLPGSQRILQDGYCLIVQFLEGPDSGTVARLLDVYYNPHNLQCPLPGYEP